MLSPWHEQQRQADITALGFDERFALLVEAEWLQRENQRLVRNLREAKLRLSQATLEDLDYPACVSACKFDPQTGVIGVPN